MEGTSLGNKVKRSLAQALIVTMFAAAALALLFALMERITKGAITMETLNGYFLPSLFLVSSIWFFIFPDSNWGGFKEILQDSALTALVAASLAGLPVMLIVLIFFPGENYENTRPRIWNPAQLTGAIVFPVAFVIAFVYKLLKK